MTDINTDEHCSLGIQGLRELQVVKIATNLAVDLPQNVSCLRQVKLHGIPDSDHL